MIFVQDLVFAYEDDRYVFNHFDWRIQRGESWAVLGPSGCGKSTLLYLIAGLRFPISGKVLVDGEPILRPRPHTGFIIQDYGLLPWATVRENAELGLKIRNFYGPDGRHAPRNTPMVEIDSSPWLKRLGLLDIQDKYPSQISGGQRQRTAIARTLSLNPDLLLMDEPFSSLDAPTREDMQALTLDLWREHDLTLVSVTHSIEEAAILGENILLLHAPPNEEAQVIKNPGMHDSDYRLSREYQSVCLDLRERMHS